MVISLHQPNFCPYAGIFEKIAQSDVFVLLNNVQYTKNNFQSRFMYNEKWYTMRCNQSHELIKDKAYLYPAEDWMKITNSLPKLKVFNPCFGSSKFLYKINGAIIRQACEILGIKTKIVDDYATNKTGTDRLIAFCKLYNADTYLSGISGVKYLEMEKFEQSGINVIFQESPDKRALVELL